MKIPVLIICLFLTLNLFSQQSTQTAYGWHLLDATKDQHHGISLPGAYELLKNKPSTTVIVAVIDSGVDTAHEDLKPILWVNTREIAGNGVDDDGNGYVDDIYGWNFCGSRDGVNLERNSHEITRVYHGWKKEFEGRKEKSIPADKRFLYQQWEKAARLIDKDYAEAKKILPDLERYVTIMDNSAKAINDYLKTEQFTADQIRPLLQNENDLLKQAADFWTGIFVRFESPTLNSKRLLDDYNAYKWRFVTAVDRKENAPVDLRGQLVKDTYTDINDRYYGNNNLKIGSGDHGTLVSGVIGATRNNNLGVDGIADNVRIMNIRAVPGGDEHDKDVALAIRYAVDNGAKVINMSFGKPVSPYKQFVDDAVRYAASKDVLLVHGAGNDGLDIGENVFYPNPEMLDGTRAKNYITVGASGEPKQGGFAAGFSNYSSKVVDLFAPGVNIYSTAHSNAYKSADGTSLASPVVAGVAALVRSYYPSLTAEQVAQILNESAVKVNEKVARPGGGKEVQFSQLSISGGILNAEAAIRLAEKIWKSQRPAS